MASDSPSPSPSGSPSPSPSAIEPTTPVDAISSWTDWVFSDAPLRLAFIFVFTAVVYWLVSRLIKRVVKRTSETEGRMHRRATEDVVEVGLQRERRAQRAKAIGSLVTSVFAVFLWGSAVMMALPVLGINIAPLLASAGVIGVALGFGAQTLVKDYLSGIFMILEDQFGVGDYVDLGEAVGTVDEVTLRVTRLRDPSGIIWYVRNGEILRIGNQTQGWSTGSVEVPVASDENPAKVLTILDGVADAVFADEKWKDVLLEKPNVAGVDKIAGGAMTVKIFAKCAPNQQWGVQRDLLERSLEALQKAGVKGPVQLPGRLPL